MCVGVTAPLAADDLRGDHCGVGRVAFPELQLAMHLAPDARVAPHDLAAVVTERTLREGEKSKQLLKPIGDTKQTADHQY